MRRWWRKYALWRHRVWLREVAILRREMQLAIDDEDRSAEYDLEQDLTRALERSYYWARKTPVL